MKLWNLSWMVALAVVSVGCDKAPEVSSSATNTGTTATATATASTPAVTPHSTSTAMVMGSVAPSSSAAGATVGDIVWEVPKAWQTVPSASSMRKATYKIPKAAGDADDAELSVTQVGGGLDANIQRWAGQFSDSKIPPKQTKKTVGPLAITIVEIHGTFAGSGMPGAPAAGPKKSQALLGAIVESTDPPYFFKMTGPEKTVMGARADLDKLVGSMKAK